MILQSEVAINLDMLGVEKVDTEIQQWWGERQMLVLSRS